MSTEAAFHQLLSSNLPLRNMGWVDGSIQRSVATASPEERPFMVLRWGDHVRAFGNVGTSDVTLWLYDEGASYDRIDEAIEHLRSFLPSVAGYVADDGSTLNQIIWRGGSGDLYDDMWKCVTRNVVFTVS